MIHIYAYVQNVCFSLLIEIAPNEVDAFIKIHYILEQNSATLNNPNDVLRC